MHNIPSPPSLTLQATATCYDGCLAMVQRWRLMTLEELLSTMLLSMGRWRWVEKRYIQLYLMHVGSLLYLYMREGDAAWNFIIYYNTISLSSPPPFVPPPSLSLSHTHTHTHTLQVLKVLVATGVNPHIQDNDGLTPADLAEDCGHGACASYLRSCPVPPEQPETQVYYTSFVIHGLVIMTINYIPLPSDRL